MKLLALTFLCCVLGSLTNIGEAKRKFFNAEETEKSLTPNERMKYMKDVDWEGLAKRLGIDENVDVDEFMKKHMESIERKIEMENAKMRKFLENTPEPFIVPQVPFPVPEEEEEKEKEEENKALGIAMEKEIEKMLKAEKEMNAIE
jgi:hypothetical protein